MFSFFISASGASAFIAVPLVLGWRRNVHSNQKACHSGVFEKFVIEARFVHVLL